MLSIVMHEKTKPATRMYRDPDLTELVPVHPSTRYRWEQRGLFPRRIVLGPNSVGWRADEVEAWLASRVRQQDTQRPSPNPRAKSRRATSEAR